jgi:hypothetical protein
MVVGRQVCVNSLLTIRSADPIILCMGLFHKNMTPAELGSLLYETLRAGVASDGNLSLNSLVRSLDAPGDDLDMQYAGEVMLGCMFGAILAVDRSSSSWLAEQIVAGMKTEFLRHVAEQGATPRQVVEWQDVLETRLQEFRDCLIGYEDLEPPWKLGRRFYWNIIGDDRYVALSIKIATLYILEARDVAQDLLNKHGPGVEVRAVP